MLSEYRTGPGSSSPGAVNPARQDRTLASVSQDAHARMHEANYLGTLFTFGVTQTALAAANATVTGVTSSAQPIVGLWNPSTSLVNLVLWKISAVTSLTANTAVAPGGFVYLVSTGQSAITAGSNPFSCKTLAQSGSAAKAFSMGTALTGLSGSLVVMRGSAIAAMNAAGPATAIHQPIAPTEELFDGSIFVPPGGVFVMMNTLSTTTNSLTPAITWEEVAI